MFLSAFERTGVAYLAGSRRSLKIIVEGKTYYVHMRDIHCALYNPVFKAHILRLEGSEPFVCSRNSKLKDWLAMQCIKGS